MPKQIIIHFISFLETKFQDMENCIGYENLFANFIKTQEINHVKILGTIGFEGYVSVSRSYSIG
jgi:hypothetical protein